MCGRFSLMRIGDFLNRFNVEYNEPLKPRYNIAPGQDVPVILNSSPDKVSMLRWGLIPFWAKDESIGYKMINARAETLTEKNSFKRPFRKYRCLVPADGFYEWKNSAAGKIPFRITMKDDSLFAFAGIYNVWKNEEKELHTFSIITTEPNEIVRQVHDRMPAILKREDEKTWLENHTVDDLQLLLKPYPAEKMKSCRVSTRVNNPENDTPDVIEPFQSKSLLDY